MDQGLKLLSVALSEVERENPSSILAFALLYLQLCIQYTSESQNLVALSISSCSYQPHNQKPINPL